ncbi:hypothetical protein AMECASPLE_000291 [Ameca splendens]|uniref:Uncharacterized protein n=1 Tax=Ameca splendens TaxID=208324 RepID=A0ABV0XXI3_9TELE
MRCGADLPLHAPPFHDFIRATSTVGFGRCSGEPSSPHRTPLSPASKAFTSALITLRSSWCFLSSLLLQMLRMFSISAALKEGFFFSGNDAVEAPCHWITCDSV